MRHGGPEFGTVQRPDLVKAAREAGDAGFDVVIACAFNYEAHASEFSKLGRIPVLKARMNADFYMGGELKATGKSNLTLSIECLPVRDLNLQRASDSEIFAAARAADVAVMSSRV